MAKVLKIATENNINNIYENVPVSQFPPSVIINENVSLGMTKSQIIHVAGDRNQDNDLRQQRDGKQLSMWNICTY